MPLVSTGKPTNQLYSNIKLNVFEIIFGIFIELGFCLFFLCNVSQAFIVFIYWFFLSISPLIIF